MFSCTGICLANFAPTFTKKVLKEFAILAWPETVLPS